MAVGTATAIYLGVTGVMAAYKAKQQRNAAKQLEEGGDRAREAANSQADLQDWNASIARLQAMDARERGKEAEERFRQGVKMTIGAQRAGFAAQNVDVGFGSAVDVVADSAYLGELDALQIRTNAAREAWGFEVAAEDYTKRAKITRKEGVYLEAGMNEQASQVRSQMYGDLLQTGGGLLLNKYGMGKSPTSQKPPKTTYTAPSAPVYTPPTSTYGGAFRGVRF